MTDQDGELLSLTSSRVGTAVVVTAAGEVDTFTVPRLRTALRDALALPGRGPVVLDLTDVSFLGSAGLGALVATENDAAAAHQEPLRVVVDHNRPVLTPLHVLGLDHSLALYETVSDALLNLQKPPIK